jgi:membrane protein implicated in regulation of membrane protease activity
MYGTFSGMSFGLVAVAALVVIALALFASPLLAVIIAGAVAVLLLIGMSAARRRSEALDKTPGGAPDTHSGGPGTRGSRGRSQGEPASGEGT